MYKTTVHAAAMRAAWLLAPLTAMVLCAGVIRAEPTTLPNGFHFRPNKGAFADAIPFYWKGTYHVFYLWAGRGGTTWEHLSSTDLLHWQEHPTALRPGAKGTPDADSIFTGSIIERDGTFHAFYTGWNPAHATHREQIMHATSSDLVAWTKHPEHTFHADGTVYQDAGGKDFRDPFVFRHVASGKYVMLLFARKMPDGGGVVGRYVSDDLLTWTPAEPLAGAQAGECPDWFESDGREYLLLSRGGMWWASAGALHQTWQVPKVPQLDTPLLYAVKRLYDGKRHVAFGFVRDLKGESDLGAQNWGGTMGLPREVYRDERGELRVRPVAELARVFDKSAWSLTAAAPLYDARAGEWKHENGVLSGKGGVVSLAVNAPADYLLRVSAKCSPIARVQIRFRDQGPHGGGYSLVIDRRHQTTELRAPLHTFERGTPLANDRPVTVEAYVLGNIIECFVNDAHAFTTRAYDFRTGALSITVDEGGATLTELDIRTVGGRGDER